MSIHFLITLLYFDLFNSFFITFFGGIFLQAFFATYLKGMSFLLLLFIMFNFVQIALFQDLSWWLFSGCLATSTARFFRYWVSCLWVLKLKAIAVQSPTSLGSLQKQGVSQL